jgi:tRNA (guanine-N7-)-methyltransferase
MAAVLEQRQRRIHGRRQSHRIRPARKRLLAERLPSLQLDVPGDGALIELDPLFNPAHQRRWLEIGFGGGEHLAAQAEAHPEIGLIGCEPYVNGVARLLSLLGDRDNMRVVIDDARLLLKALPDRSFERIFVLFPDPWPKLRHRKRRIVNGDTVADMARLLQPGGELRLATDDMSYARAMLRTIGNGRVFEWLAQRAPDWRERPDDWPPTRYEQKALTAGRRPVYFRFQRLRYPLDP